MKTGIVVSNYDPKYKNRLKIRVYGMHNKQIDGQYEIIDDDLPWVLPAPNMGNNSGTSAIPDVGARVYVDGDNNNNLRYYGQVEINKDIKQIQFENAEQNDKIKIIAYEVDKSNSEDYMKIMYLPDKELCIEAYGHKILLTKYDGVKISSKEGCSIEMTRDADMNITCPNNINIDCRKLNLTQGSLDEETVDKIVLGSRLQEIFNKHTHFCATPGGVTTTEPINKIKETDFSKNIRISNTD